MALREILARFGIQVDGSQLAAANQGIAGAIGSLKTFGAVIAGSAIVRGAANFVKDTVAMGDELGKTSAQLGIGTTELQRWRVAAQLTGASTDDLTKGLRTLAKNALASTQSASSETARAFKSLNIDVQDSNGNFKTTQQLMRETGVALSGVENNLERTALAQQLFGRAGTKLLPLFAQGEEGLEKLLKKLDEFGGGFTEDAIKQSEALADAFLGWDVAGNSLRSTLAVAFLPLLTQIVSGLTKVIAFVSKVTAGTNTWQAILIALGGVLAKLAIAKFGGQLLSLARAAALPLLKFAMLVLIVDDLITLFKGGDSLIGRVIDKIFGKGSAKALIDGIKGVGTAISDVLKTGDFEAFDKALEDIFGPPGQDIVADIVFTFEMIGEELDKFASEMKEGISLLLSDIGQGALDLGKAVIDGIVDGIKDGANAVVDAVKGVANGAIDAAKSVFNSDSPSKVFRDIGRDNMAGLVQGQQQSAQMLSRLGSASLQASGVPSVSAPGRGGGTASPSSVTQNNTMNINLTGGSPNDPQLQKLRQGIRTELNDNRRALMAALVATVDPA